VIILTKKLILATFWAIFFTNSSGHTARLTLSSSGLRRPRLFGGCGSLGANLTKIYKFRQFSSKNRGSIDAFFLIFSTKNWEKIGDFFIILLFGPHRYYVILTLTFEKIVKLFAENR
jgi:hypothetical protein